MNKKMNLICLPFAGGNKYSYREFADKAPSFLNIITLEYPGRGTRMQEPLPSGIDELTDDLYNQIMQYPTKIAFAIYGHSLGGLMAYLLALKLNEKGNALPSHLFITGTTGPSAISRTEKKRHLLNQDEFVAEIKELGGMPDEILNNDELLYFFEPILRSDFKISENYIFSESSLLDIPITVINGTEEDMEADEIQLWQDVTSQPVDFKRMPGNHFFIFQHSYKIIEIISKKLYLLKPPLKQ
jgi:surfactin synthase thioesterase subunit